MTHPQFIALESLGILRWRWDQLLTEREVRRRRRLFASFSKLLVELRLIESGHSVAALGAGINSAGEHGLIVVFSPEDIIREASA
jgi:hypothetical protein